MNRMTVAVATAAAAAGGAAVWYRLRTRAEHGVAHHSATVLTDLDETLAAWREPGRVPGLLAEATPTTDETEPAAPVPGDGQLALRVLLTPAPAQRGTEIRVRAEGPTARAHSGRLREDLRRLKAILECGEALTVEGQPSARGPAAEQLQERVYVALRRGGMG
ncbi:hypothetical protein NI17_004205 [Thermobifida halotolerans]|uniref:Uncharacterized protein n=1 Tax=Thermobifida halotolerans TaxID=483545 RepID=A0A399G743_9ACTN|nr:hypothetical protein [Thermobifida halotolerans]UOE20443.1 hypothetical protein NI17_004205 [Thermobifida halotolerans]